MDSSSAADAAAADRHHAFEFWEVFILVNGTYNPTMRPTFGTRLPTETKKLARPGLGHLIGKPTESFWNFRANGAIYVGLKYDAHG
ncbi:hypothetical protein LXA43DRAFT_1101090 [Ganoderma leucocontextum]|nr:hypothetical protein LXA43DRAFT_1101090 [Ganoderma leucocontextum]